MPRARRNFTAGGIYHVYSRGSNRQALFRFDADRLDFLSCLARVAKRHDLACYAYCLMPNHFHLVVETPDGRLSEAMKALNGRYAFRFNRRYARRRQSPLSSDGARVTVYHSVSDTLP